MLQSSTSDQSTALHPLTPTVWLIHSKTLFSYGFENTEAREVMMLVSVNSNPLINSFENKVSQMKGMSSTKQKHVQHSARYVTCSVLISSYFWLKHFRIQNKRIIHSRLSFTFNSPHNLTLQSWIQYKFKSNSLNAKSDKFPLKHFVFRKFTLLFYFSAHLAA